VHALASAAGNIGAEELHRVAQDLESRIRTARVLASDPMLPNLERLLADALSAAADFVTTGPVREYDPDPPQGLALEKVLEQLERLLDEHDTAAVDCVEALLPLPFELGVSDDFRRLEASVRAYDFEQARHHLSAVKGALAHVAGEPSSE
jgi:HPt (histidine-containing phosphotransfer) domain-containing protein